MYFYGQTAISFLQNVKGFFMPTATPSVYRRFHKYCKPSLESPVKLYPDEVVIDSCNSVNLKLPPSFTILEGDIKVSVMGQTDSMVRQTFCGDSISQALKKAKSCGATNISVLLG